MYRAITVILYCGKSKITHGYCLVCKTSYITIDCYKLNKLGLEIEPDYYFFLDLFSIN